MHHGFNETAATDADAPKKYPLPLSLRLTYEERARLEAEADDKPLGAYISERLLGDDVAPRARRDNSPVKDKEALGRVMDVLDASRLSANLKQLAKAVNLPLFTAKTREACLQDRRHACRSPESAWRSGGRAAILKAKERGDAPQLARYTPGSAGQ